MKVKQVILARRRRNVLLRRYRIHTYVHVTLTSDLENLFNNSRSHDEYLWQVSLKLSKQSRQC